MRIKTILNVAIACSLLIANYACNDDLTSIGSTIKPDGDNIFLGTDSIQLTARTQKVESIYAETEYTYLGEYVDQISGKVKYDFMYQLKVSAENPFKENTLEVDSVWLNTYIIADSIIGDTKAPMAFAAYKLKKQLTNNHHTNFDVNQYVDFTQQLGKTLFTANELIVSSGVAKVGMNVNKALGAEILSRWQANPDFFNKQENFNQYLPGVYITSTFGSGSLYPVFQTDLLIKYKYQGRNAANTSDSAHVAYLTLSNAKELYQMNKIQNSISSEYIDQPASNGDITYNNKVTYISSPSGLYTELTIPLQDILNKIGENRVINSAAFNLMAYTEEEMKSSLVSPRDLLMIRESEVKDFFESNTDNLKDMGRSKALLMRSGSSNYYNFVTITNTSSPNLSDLLNYYLTSYKADKSKYPGGVVRFMLIPITKNESLFGQQTIAMTRGYNQMRPTLAAIRTSPEHMKIKIGFNEIKPK